MQWARHQVADAVEPMAWDSRFWTTIDHYRWGFRQGMPYSESVEFSRELRASVLSGDITVSFRLWRRPQVKAGGRYRVGDGQIEVDSVELMPFAFIDESDIRRAGEADRASLRRRAAHAGPIHDETVLYRIEFHWVDSFC